MPTLMARGCDPALVSRVRQYARTRGGSTSDTIAHLLTVALDHLDARAAGGKLVQQGKTPEQRQDAARYAARARWQAFRDPP